MLVLNSNFFNYYVYPDGKVYSLTTKKYIKQHNDGNGYLIVKLRNNGVSKNYKVHRLVANVYIENKNNYPQVNHIDGNKLNNNYTNLEWVTRSKNLIHAYKLGLKKKDRSKIVIDLSTGIFYDSAREAAIAKNINQNTLRVKLAGFFKNNTSINYI